MSTAGDTGVPAPAGAGAELSGRERRALRAMAHRLKPVVHVGHAGPSDAVLAEIDRALADHELIKVRLHLPEDKRTAARALADRAGAILLGMVGHTVILFRRNPEAPEAPISDRG